MSAELFRTPGNEADPQIPVAGGHSDADAIAPSNAYPGIPDVRQLIQFQVEQLATQIPVLAVRLTYRDLNQGNRQSVVYVNSDQPGYDPQIYDYLESEAWLDPSLSLMSLHELTVHKSLQNKDANRGGDRPHIYIYLLSRHDVDVDYLLIWSAETLTEPQQQAIEKAGQALQHILAIAKGYSRQKAEIQLLEHVLYRAEHQLRSPLALISLYAENLRLELIDTPLKEQAILIRDVVDELTTNLTDLLYCGQRARLRVAPHDLRTIVMDSIKGLQPWIDQKHLGVHYPTTPVTLMVDRWQLKQAIDNLLNNAIHFSPSHGIITWRWHVFQDEVLVEIADEGPGLSADGLKQAFKPFYSQREGGTGLGLAIAQKIILDHQGNLWAENLPRGGAQFSFTLPRKGHHL